MLNPKDKNIETVDSSSNTENTLAEVVEQYNNTDVPIENTNLSDTHIIPFDSENGMKMELWLQYFDETCRQHNKNEENFLQPIAVNFADFSQHHLKKNDDLVKYFHEKLNCGKRLGLSPQLILEGLTDGLPTQFKAPNAPTEWLTVATKLLKIQESSPAQKSQK
ncbi:hypothetical protein AVEN_195726-1 [Araneus ventricosus]|uniref:Uncharacterized protein n=1 Tax=Araneus ventricosus TaxID=182803 RepID=A0A4Y2UAA5_ARAVE|nr:hypothetical protein AVEN_195726-1 [Araneus ventricosus]